MALVLLNAGRFQLVARPHQEVGSPFESVTRYASLGSDKVCRNRLDSRRNRGRQPHLAHTRNWDNFNPKRNPMKILFICTHNRCRSILSEAITNHLGKDKFQAFSAGSQPAGLVHP